MALPFLFARHGAHLSKVPKIHSVTYITLKASKTLYKIMQNFT